jgi:hypothetical protein
VITDGLPFDYSVDFVSPGLTPSDAIIEFRMESRRPEDSAGHQEMAVKSFVSIKHQSFSLDTHEAGASTVELNEHRGIQTLKEAARGAFA